MRTHRWIIGACATALGLVAWVSPAQADVPIGITLRTNILVSDSTDSAVDCASGSGLADGCLVLPTNREVEDLSIASVGLDVSIYQFFGVSLNWEPITELKFDSVDSGIPQREYEIGQVWRVGGFLEYPLCMDDYDCWMTFPIRVFGGGSFFVPGYERDDGAADFCNEALTLGRACSVEDGVAGGWNAGGSLGLALDFEGVGIRTDAVMTWERFDWWDSSRERSGGVVTDRTEHLERFQFAIGVGLFLNLGDDDW